MMLRFPSYIPGCRQGHFHLLIPSQTGTQKSPKSVMFTTFFYASASILSRGIARLVPESIFCVGNSVPWYFLVDPQQEIFMPEDSICCSSKSWCYPGLLGRSAGPVEPDLFVLLLWCWTQPSVVPQAPSETLGAGDNFWGAVPASFITSYPGIPTPSQHTPFPLTNAMPCSQRQQLVANTAKGSCNLFPVFLGFFLLLSHFKLGALHACSWKGQRGRQQGGKGRGLRNICFTFNLEPNFFIMLLQPCLYIDSITRLC